VDDFKYEEMMSDAQADGYSDYLEQLEYEDFYRILTQDLSVPADKIKSMSTEEMKSIGLEYLAEKQRNKKKTIILSISLIIGLITALLSVYLSFIQIEPKNYDYSESFQEINKSLQNIDNIYSDVKKEIESREIEYNTLLTTIEKLEIEEEDLNNRIDSLEGERQEIIHEVIQYQDEREAKNESNRWADRFWGFIFGIIASIIGGLILWGIKYALDRASVRKLQGKATQT